MGEVPEEQNRANESPASKEDLGNHMPVSLTSVPGKVTGILPETTSGHSKNKVTEASQHGLQGNHA